MSTPKDPGRKLPGEPAAPPSLTDDSAVDPAPSAASGTAPADRTTDTRSVLERLRAAQPRQVASASDDHGAHHGARHTGPGTTATAEAPRADGPRTATSEASRAQDPTDTAASRRAARDEQARETKERLRLAVVRTRVAAAVTGKAVGRGSSAAVRHIGSWNADVVRQVVVTLCLLACVVGSAAGVGAFGGASIRDAAGGLFAPDATLLAPSSSAFSIWGVIYAGLIVYTVFQWLPGQRDAPRQRHLGWTVAASMLLNLAWILSAQADRLTLGLVIILLLLLTLLAAVHTLNGYPTRTRLEGVFVDTPIGLYLGWVLPASAANAAAFLTGAGIDLFGLGGNTWAVIGVVGVLMTAAVICSTDRGRLAVAAATAWGLFWIGVERALSEPSAFAVALAAAVAIFLLLITAGSRRHRVDHAYRRWLRAQEDAKREPLDLLRDGHDGYEDYEDSRY